MGKTAAYHFTDACQAIRYTRSAWFHMIHYLSYPPACRSLCHELPVSFAKYGRELALVPAGDDVVEPRLPAEFVNPLSNLVACSVSKTGEEGEETGMYRGSRIITEYNLGDCRRRDLRSTTLSLNSDIMEGLLTLIVLLLISRLAMVSTGWKTSSSATPDAPEPRTRAVPDSLYLLPDGGDIA